MKRGFVVRLLLVLGLACFTGCATYDAPMPAANRLEGKQRFFVFANLNDNHGIAHQIAAALRVRGGTAEVGPMTMMPDDTQVVISYEDNWAWDFGDHLVHLQLTARDRKSRQPLGVVRFTSRVPARRAIGDVVGQLVDQLVVPPKK